MQARLFSVVTGDYYQHVLQYIGDNKVIHTRQGRVGIDDLSEFAPYFLEGCTIVRPKLSALVPAILKNCEDKPIQSEGAFFFIDSRGGGGTSCLSE